MQRMLTIDDDVLAAAENLAMRQGKTLDEVLSDVGRRALLSRDRRHAIPADLPVLPVRDSTPVTLEFVNAIRDGIDF